MNTNGILYWITGYYGSGKTSLGNSLFYRLKDKGTNVVFLDGDVLKSIFDETPSFTTQDRHQRAMKYAKLCKVLTDQNVTVICCTISMFSDVREWNRKNNKGYVEIFLDVPLETLKKRDQKDIYSDELAVKEYMDWEKPASPDIVLKEDNLASIEECVKKILDHKIQFSSAFDRDTDYWNKFYATKTVMEPSPFAATVFEQLEPGKRLLELGCGNGRDSLLFASKLFVTAIDASDQAISNLQKLYDGVNPNIKFICDDFVCMSALYHEQYDYCYSRFTLHSINEEQEQKMIENVFNTLKKGGKFFVEVRSIHDDIYGLGEPAGRNEFIYNGHYRRFVVKEELEERFVSAGFRILYSEESRGFAPFENSDPPVLRVIVEKQ